MQIFYNKTSIKKNFISCYVKVFHKNDKVYLINTLFNTDIELSASNEDINLLLSELSKGISTTKLLSILKKFSNSNEELYVYMLQQGIIE